MIMFQSAIAEAARQAGMAVPPDEQLDSDESPFDPEKYPHFHVYCNVQLGCPVTWGNHWENAKIIAAVLVDKLRTMTYAELEGMGFSP